MPEVRTDDAVLHVEVDGTGEPITVLAHGLTNSCQELAAFTPLVAGTKVRFCFRGHGHSSVPGAGYGFADFARDLDAVANTYGARNAVGTSLGAGAICHLLGDDPARFDRIVLLLPAALDHVVGGEGFVRTASVLESMPLERAIDTILSEPGRVAKYRRAPWLREFDLLLWRDMNPVGVARSLRGIVGDVAIRDRELLREVDAPVLIIGREGDALHPAAVARVLGDVLRAAEVILLPGEQELIAAIPMLVERVGSFLTGDR